MFFLSLFQSAEVFHVLISPFTVIKDLKEVKPMSKASNLKELRSKDAMKKVTYKLHFEKGYPKNEVFTALFVRRLPFRPTKTKFSWLCLSLSDLHRPTWGQSYTMRPILYRFLHFRANLQTCVYFDGGTKHKKASSKVTTNY